MVFMQNNYGEDKKMSFQSFLREMFSCKADIPASPKKSATQSPIISANRDEDGVLSICRGQTPIGWISFDKSQRCYKAVTAGGEVRNFTNEQAALGFVHEQYA